MAEMTEMLTSLTKVLKDLTVQQTPQLPKVKQQKFKGPPKLPGDPSLKEWLDEFESYCHCYKLSGKTKAQALIDHLGGVAKEEILCRDESIKGDFDKLVEVLKSQFAPVESLQSLSASFHAYTQKDGESLADFSRNLMRLYNRMEQVAPSKEEREALQALRDTSLKEGLVRGAKEAWVRRELRRIEMAQKGKSFMDMRTEVLDFFRDQDFTRKVSAREVVPDPSIPVVETISCSKEAAPVNKELDELRGN